MKKEWSVHSPDPDHVSRLSTQLGCHQVVAAVLINRGFKVVEEATAFLEPAFVHMRSPFLMKEMDRAVDRILVALEQREKVLVFGDYDADGMTATALLFEFLRKLDMDVVYYIPDRLTEGYGLTPQAVERQALSRNVKLIITVDCGMSSHEAVLRAKGHGIDVIVTDHHEAPPHLPEALAIVNPKQPGCPSGLTCLAGVGIAFNLALALRKRLRDMGFWETRPEPNLKAACDLVAIGTIADMVPILEENRIYVKAGLQVLSASERPGVQALLRVSGLSDTLVDTWDVAFKLAPRLNAAGRLRHGSMGCQLLTTSDPRTAQRLAEALDRENNRRQEIEKSILSDVLEHIKACPETLGKALVLEKQGWHEGVVGVVASRLVNQFLRPVVLIAVADGMGKGSARSPKGFDLFEALKACAPLLERFGGHEAAAGLALRAEHVPAFRKEFEKRVSERATSEDFLPQFHIDTEVSPAEISPDLADELENLAPFGSGNPEPLLMLSDLEVCSRRTLGRIHTQMHLRPSGKTAFQPLRAVFFNMGPDASPPDRFRRVACHLRWNRWNSQKKMQLVVRDFVEG
jgi:single-stranded-DNA-specific exonuclease